MNLVAPISLVVKLASIAVHAEEMLSPNGHYFDRETIKSLLNDLEVRGFLDDPANAAFLPLKRKSP